MKYKLFILIITIFLLASTSLTAIAKDKTATCSITYHSSTDTYILKANWLTPESGQLSVDWIVSFSDGLMLALSQPITPFDTKLNLIRSGIGRTPVIGISRFVVSDADMQQGNHLLVVECSLRIT